MHPTETYQLSIEFVSQGTAVGQVKDDVKNWLLGMGEESFVEGYIDNLFLDLDYATSSPEQYEELGGDVTPLLIYKYDRQHLEDLQIALEKCFPQNLHCKLDSIQTQVWMEGWKESFKPIQTEKFYIYPPWLSENLPVDRLHLLIEPGMAFGTGQHATTVLCLEALEELPAARQLLDVGTGTGILAIAASKFGYKHVIATDIDPDSMIAARANALANNVDLELEQGTFPSQATSSDVVVANIIYYVLKQIIGELSAQVSPGGYLILSGLLIDETREMSQLAEAHGLELVGEKSREDWASQVYRKA